MYFTREPIIETVITPKEGYKLHLRSTRGGHSEEFFVEALEVISFGSSCFYRSSEKTRPFLVPVTDYELLEVRDAKMVLKTPNVEKVKIAGGRESAPRESSRDNQRDTQKEPKVAKEVAEESSESSSEAPPPPEKGDRRRERRRFRRRKEERNVPEEAPTATALEEREKKPLIPPPPTLISETLSRYKEIPGFAGAFFDRDESKLQKQQEEIQEELQIERTLEIPLEE